MFGSFECHQSKPFDLRRERRQMYRYHKRYRHSKKDLYASGVMQSVRQFNKVMAAQYEAFQAEVATYGEW